MRLKRIEDTPLTLAVSDILTKHWDPIGIQEFGIDDEYLAYARHICQHKEWFTKTGELEAYLQDTISERMGLTPSCTTSNQAVILIRALL